MSPDNYERAFEMMLAMQRCGEKPFPQHLVDTLDQFFPGHAITLLTGPSYELFAPRPKLNPYMDGSAFYQPSFFNRKSFARLEEYVQETYYRSDPEQPANIPENLRSKTVLRYSDLMSHEEFRKNKMYSYLDSCGIATKATIYLYENDMCMGGIAMMRGKDLGAYSPEELRLFEMVGKSASTLYLSYLRETFNTGVSDIYRKYYDSVDVGLALITDKAEVLESNDIIFEFCQEIAAALSQRELAEYLIPVSATPIAKTVRMITRRFTSITANVEEVIHMGGDAFHCLLKPCMLTAFGTDMHTMYVLRIRKEPGAGVSVPGAVALQYGLTNREKDIVDLIAMGYKTDQISNALFISRNTVKNHIANIYRKTEVTSRIELLGKMSVGAGK